MKWAEDVSQILFETQRTIEQYFTCGICTNLCLTIQTLEPCLHSFCKKCFENQAKASKCGKCKNEFQKRNENLLDIEFLDSIEPVIGDIVLIQKRQKILESEYQAAIYGQQS